MLLCFQLHNLESDHCASVMESTENLHKMLVLEDNLETSTEQVSRLQTCLQTYKDMYSDCSEHINILEHTVDRLQLQLENCNELVRTA